MMILNYVVVQGTNTSWGRWGLTKARYIWNRLYGLVSL